MQLKIAQEKIFYQSEGSSHQGIIFIHGLCGDRRVWTKTIPTFSASYQTIALDLFGHGDSSKDINPQEAFEEMPRVIERLIQRENLDEVVLVGHSIAGNILCECMEKNIDRVKGYVFLDCAWNATQRVVDSRNKLADELMALPTDEFFPKMKKWYQTMMEMDQPQSDNELILSAIDRLEGKWTMEFLKATNLVRKAPKTNVPTLLFESKWLTKIEPERSFRKAFPNSKLVMGTTPSHFFFVYDPDPFNQKLRSFVDQCFDEK